MDVSVPIVGMVVEYTYGATNNIEGKFIVTSVEEEQGEVKVRFLEEERGLQNKGHVNMATWGVLVDRIVNVQSVWYNAGKQTWEV